MNAGHLRDLITVQEQGSTQDAFGDQVGAWSDVFTDYAEVKRLGGREFFSQARAIADVDVRVLIRYRTGIKPKHRIKFEDQYFDIKAIIPDQRRTQIEIFCKEAMQ